MPAARPSSSSRTAAFAVLSAVLGISGCAGHGALLGDATLRLTTIDDSQTAAAAVPQPRIVPAAETPATQDIVVQASPKRSAWCDYLKEDAAADATVMRSPTLGGQIDDQNKGSVSLSLSYSSFRKASLIEQSAEARCRSYMAESGLQKVVFLAPQTLSAAGYGAKAAAIQRHTANLERAKARINKELKAGTITAGTAASLTAMIEGLYSAAAEARSQAPRRETADGMLTGPAAQYSAELLRAEDDLADISSRMRTADAFDVSLEAGYNDSTSGNGLDTLDDGLSGKVKFSMKLGAFAPQRYEHEQRARQARPAAIRDQEGGALWQIRALREAHQKATSGLEDSRARLERAIAETRHFLSVHETTPDPEFAGAAIEAKLRLIQLESDKAAVTGSLAEIRAKLKQLAPG